ncbi:MAG: AMP-dependent synthetase [Betaproteobacteria bacterium]|nr:MAG: AMP-dependent synthetase [Betaproteobacteria bacterium]
MDAKSAYLSRPWLKFYEPGVPANPEVPLKSVTQAFDDATSKYGAKAALVFYGRDISFRELREHTDRLAGALARLGLKKGDRVGLYLLNSPQFVIAYFAALKLGCTVTPISPVYTSHEVKFQLENSGARVIVCQDILFDKVEKSGATLDQIIVTSVSEYLPGLKKFLGKTFLGKIFGDVKIGTPNIPKRDNVHQFQDLLAGSDGIVPAVTIDPKTDIAALPYTGGTTGNPKGVVLTHYNMIAAQVSGQAAFPGFDEGREVIIAFLPFFHIYGQVVLMLNGLIQGQTLVLFTTPDTEGILEAMEKYKATVFYGVPTLYEYLKDHKDTGKVNWKRLKMLISGADTLHESTMKDWAKRTGSSITEGYGLSETCAASHVNPRHRPKPGSFGLPIPNVMAAVIEPEGTAFVPPGETGELILKGPNIMLGYWNKPEESAKVFLDIDGERWMRTGDIVRMDEEGYFHFFDRSKDLIKYKGYSVFAKDIEDVLYEHPNIKAAGVIGVPDPAVGQKIKAIVVLQPEARGKLSEEDVLAYCRESLAGYKVPHIVEFRGELPKTDVGKVSRRELRDEHAS